MSAITVPWFAACAVLALAGAAKLHRPEPTMGALRAAGLPGGRSLVLGLGGAEILLAVGGIATGAAALAAALAVLHLGFAGFVLATLRRGAMVQTCGCFGSPDVPATALHVAFNLGTAAVGAIAVAHAPPTLGAVVEAGGLGVLTLGLAALAAFQVIVALTILPRARFAAVAAAGGARW